MVYKSAKVTLNRLQKHTTFALRHVIWLLSNQRWGFTRLTYLIFLTIMKTIRLFVVTVLLMAAGHANAQLSVNVNIGNPPAWGPAGYTEVRYYYLPDISMYYDVSTSEYIYARNGAWVRTTVVPVRYRNYDFYNGYKVVLNDYRGGTPYVYYKTHHNKYPRGYHPGPQATYGPRPVVVNHVHNTVVVKERGHGHGGGHGHGRGHGHGKH